MKGFKSLLFCVVLCAIIQTSFSWSWSDGSDYDEDDYGYNYEDADEYYGNEMQKRDLPHSRKAVKRLMGGYNYEDADEYYGNELQKRGLHNSRRIERRPMVVGLHKRTVNYRRAANPGKNPLHPIHSDKKY